MDLIIFVDLLTSWINHEWKITVIEEKFYHNLFFYFTYLAFSNFRNPFLIHKF